MTNKWQHNFLDWPDWAKMLVLVTLTVSSVAVTVIVMVWLLELLAA